jgi:hypothetical protein
LNQNINQEVKRRQKEEDRNKFTKEIAKTNN